MNTALSFHGVVQQEERLFTVLAAAAVSESGVRDWNSWALANMALAFAKVGHKNESLFMALAAAAPRLVRDLNSQDSRVAH